MTNPKYTHQPVEPFEFEEWLREGLKGFRAKVESCTQPQGQRSFDTSEFRQHMRNARKEQLLAVRSLIDSAIDWLDPKEEPTKRDA
ncbi:MAG: hypothetical protein U0401_15760 [Anaerolineae bacterium]